MDTCRTVFKIRVKVWAHGRPGDPDYVAEMIAEDDCRGNYECKDDAEEVRKAECVSDRFRKSRVLFAELTGESC